MYPMLSVSKANSTYVSFLNCFKHSFFLVISMLIRLMISRISRVISWCILCRLWIYPSELAKQCESALLYVQGGGVEIISYNKVTSQVIRRNFTRPGLADPKLCTFIWASRTQNLSDGNLEGYCKNARLLVIYGAVFLEI